MTPQRRVGAGGHPLIVAAAVLLAFACLLLFGDKASAQDRHDRAPVAGVVDSGHSLSLNREVFQYSAAGRRDPFLSLVKSTELRPTISDLRLTTIAFDAGGHNSVAVLRDLGTKEQYRVKVGSTLGRMRVVRIDPRVVTFALEEFGYSRQESLAIGDTTIKRTP